MVVTGASRRERWLNSLAERASKRGSATSRGEVSLLAGAGVVIRAFLTVTVLVSSPQALPLAARDAQLSVGVAGGFGRVPAPASTETAELPPASADQVTEAASLPPPATPSPTPAPAAPRPAPSATTPRGAATPATVVAAGPPPPAPTTPTAPAVSPTPTPLPTSTPTSTATPAQTPPAVQVVGGGGVVLTGPRGGPLNTRGVDLYNCNDFATFEQLLAVFLASGPSDPNHLDPLHTGSPCPPEDEPSSSD